MRMREKERKGESGEQKGREKERGGREGETEGESKSIKPLLQAQFCSRFREIFVSIVVPRQPFPRKSSR